MKAETDKAYAEELLAEALQYMNVEDCLKSMSDILIRASQATHDPQVAKDMAEVARLISYTEDIVRFKFSNLSRSS